MCAQPYLIEFIENCWVKIELKKKQQRRTKTRSKIRFKLGYLEIECAASIETTHTRKLI